jgi:hypothetical protein
MVTHPWKMVYRAAALETNEGLLGKRITVAQEALMTRLTTLTGAEENWSEIRAIEKALRNLLVIKFERFGPGRVCLDSHCRGKSFAFIFTRSIRAVTSRLGNCGNSSLRRFGWRSDHCAN